MQIKYPRREAPDPAPRAPAFPRQPRALALTGPEYRARTGHIAPSPIRRGFAEGGLPGVFAGCGGQVFLPRPADPGSTGRAGGEAG